MTAPAAWLLLALLTIPSSEMKETTWSSSLSTAAFMAARSHRPMFVRVLSPAFLGTPPFPAIDSLALQRRLNSYVLVRAYYQDLIKVFPSLPPLGLSGVAVIDSKGRLLKRCAGPANEYEIDYLLDCVEWRTAQVRNGSTADVRSGSSDSMLSLTLAAMSGTIPSDRQLSSILQRSSVRERVRLLEAIADEKRARGDLAGASQSYAQALPYAKDWLIKPRIEIHRALCELRLGHYAAAMEGAKRSIGPHTPKALAEISDRIVKSARIGISPRSGMRAPRN